MSLFSIADSGAKQVYPAGLNLPPPSLLYRKAGVDYQDTARTTVAAVGNDVRSATDGYSTPHHFTRAAGNVPVAATGGGLVFTGADNKQLLSTFTIAQPFLLLMRCTFPVFQNSFLICDSSLPDQTKIRFNGTSMELRDNTNNNVLFPLWSPDSTPRVLGMYLNGASSYAYVNGSITSFNSYTNGFVYGIRLGSYVNSSTIYDVNSTVTDIGIWAGSLTVDQILALGSSLT